MMKLLFLITVTMGLSQTNSGLAILTHTTSAKRLAQANTRGAFDPFNSSEFNPAMLGLSNENMFYLNRQTWIQDVAFIGAGAVFGERKFKFSSSVKYHTIDNIELRGEVPTTNNSGLFENYSAVLSLSIATEFTENVYIGLNTEFVREKLHLDVYNTRTYDLGLLYKKNSYEIYSSYENFGTDNSFTLPHVFSMGIRKKNKGLNYGLEMQYLDKNMTQHVFLESIYNSTFSFTGGYVFSSETFSWSGGVQISFKNIYILFSYAAHKKLEEYKLFQLALNI